MTGPELLAPAGNLEKLQVAVLYGADAVYLGGQAFGLRAYSDNFTLEEMEEGTKFAHRHGAKVYVTVNIFPHNDDLAELPQYLKDVEAIGVDAIIISDPGVYRIAKQVVPDLSLHISTQANNVNWSSVLFWQDLGAKRIVLARELTLQEIKEIREKAKVELEAFVHGAMCISYSGRCLLSSYMINRDPNRGLCAHPCRWKYAVVEEKRPGEYFSVEEDERGTYIFNSRDLCMIAHLPEMIEAGLNSLKIEGRMKSVHYVATVTRAYRQAIDAYLRDPVNYRFNPAWLDELAKISHRPYTTGFYLGGIKPTDQVYHTAKNTQEYDFIGIVREYHAGKRTAIIEQRNHMAVGEEIEIFGPRTQVFLQKLAWMRDELGEEITEAPHPHQFVTIPVDHPVQPYDMLRRKR